MNLVGRAPAATQLSLRLRWQGGDGFERFVCDEANAAVVHALRHWLEQGDSPIFFLHGSDGCGRTHLLQAAAQYTGGLYLPLGELAAVEPTAVCDDLEQLPLLALDDLDAVARDPVWAEALFHLCNRCFAAGHRLLVSATVAPAALECALEDLRSRLGWGGSFRLAPLGEEGCRTLMLRRAAELGLQLSPAVLDYLLARAPRAAAPLLALLDRLDRRSLAEQRRLTVPLARDVLESDAGAQV
jgi:DnaA family protein